MRSILPVIVLLLFLKASSFSQTSHTLISSSPEYIHGPKALYEFIQANLILPDSVKKGLSGGFVFIMLDIDSFGNIKGTSILKNIKECAQCDKEALRIIGLLPKPAFRAQIIDNARVPSTFTMPFRFDLKKDSIVKGSDENLIGKWTFSDLNFKKCNDCPNISFNSDHTAKLLSDKLSWKIANNELIVSDINQPQRSSYFFSDPVYKITFSNYFRHLKLDRPGTSYYLVREK